MKRKMIYRVLGVLLLAIIIAGCGGGGSSTPPAGSLENPIDLGVVTAPVTRNESIPAYGEIFYKFTTSSSGVYTISITGVSNPFAVISWDLYGDPSYYYDPRGFCPMGLAGTVICTTPSLSANRTYYLQVDEWAVEATSYTLTIQ